MGLTPGKKPKTEWGEGRSAFRAHAAAILAEIERGRSLHAVWAEFRERLGGLSYQQFVRHARRGARSAAAPPAAAPSALGKARPKASPTPRQPPSGEAPGGGHGQRQFHYDPKVNKDDLV